MKKVAINGLGRIGRATLKIVLEESGLSLAAVNDLAPAENLAYLIKYDSVYGPYGKSVSCGDNCLLIDNRQVPLFTEKDPLRLPWDKLGVDIVFECTGVFRKGEDLHRHIEAGARLVVLSAPARDDETSSIVFGVNKPRDTPWVVSCASCTTNCVTPLIEVLARRIGIRKATMTTIHAYTAAQGIVDGPHKQFRRGRSAACNLVPTSTGAALAAARTLPQIAGRFDGVSVRVPVPCGSIADVIMVAERPTSVEEVNGVLCEEAETDRYRGVLGVTRDPLVSSDILRDGRASVVDLSMTQVIDKDLVRVMSWYDNEWGYACQMVKTALAA